MQVLYHWTKTLTPRKTCYLFLFYFVLLCFETGCHHQVLWSRELDIETRLILSFQQSSCLCLPCKCALSYSAFCCLFFWGRVSCRSGWPWTSCSPLAAVSGVLRLQYVPLCVAGKSTLKQDVIIKIQLLGGFSWWPWLGVGPEECPGDMLVLRVADVSMGETSAPSSYF